MNGPSTSTAVVEEAAVYERVYDGVGAQEWRFRKPQTVQNISEKLKKVVPRCTMYTNRWGVRVFEEWQAYRETS